MVRWDVVALQRRFAAGCERYIESLNVAPMRPATLGDPIRPVGTRRGAPWKRRLTDLARVSAVRVRSLSRVACIAAFLECLPGLGRHGISLMKCYGMAKSRSQNVFMRQNLTHEMLWKL